jgi:hypothetical protein
MNADLLSNIGSIILICYLIGVGIFIVMENRALSPPLPGCFRLCSSRLLG